MRKFNKFQVIFHMKEQVKVGSVLKNIINLISDIGVENLEIEMVTNGDAVKAFAKKTSEFEPILKDLAEKRVVFFASGQAMHNFGIKRNDLLDFVTVDSSGGGEIVKKTAAGWTCICP